MTILGHPDHNGRCPGCVAGGLLPNVARHPMCPKQRSNEMPMKSFDLDRAIIVFCIASFIVLVVSLFFG